MADEPEHKMLFDVRGKRKRVIQVIYVLLAIVMALSLIVIGLPGGINPFTGSSNLVSADSAKVSIERAEKLEDQIAANPNKTNAQGELIIARITAGNNLIEIDDNGQQVLTDDSTEQYELAAAEWDKYLKATKNNPDPAVALQVSNAVLNIAGGTVAQFQSNMGTVVEAQRYVAANAVAESKKNGPNPAAQLTALARYEYFNQEYDAAKKTRAEALSFAEDKTTKTQITTQLDAAEKQARQIGKQIDAAKKQAGKQKGQQLEDPFGSLGSGSATTTP